MSQVLAGGESSRAFGTLGGLPRGFDLIIQSFSVFKTAVTVGSTKFFSEIPILPSISLFINV